MLAGLDGPGARDGIGAEELHRALLGMQRPDRVGDEIVGDVSVEVHHEAVVAEATVLGGPRDQVRQVDPAGRELLEDRDQAAGLVGALVDHERRLVVTGARRDSLFRHEDETGLVAGVITDVLGEDLETVERGRDSGRDGGERGPALLGHDPGAFGGGVGGTQIGLGHDPAEKGVALRRGDRDRHHGLDALEGRARRREQAVLDVEHQLPLDQQVLVEGEVVLGEVDHALDRVLDGDEAVVDVAPLDGVEHIGHGAKEHPLGRGEIGLHADGLLGERAERSQEAEPHRGCGRGGTGIGGVRHARHATPGTSA